MDDRSPEILVIAGPNGAGKSTCAARYLPAGMAFLNADEVAKGLPGYPSPTVDIQAGRIVLEQMHEHEQRGDSFAVETTLATRSLATRIVRLRQSGYRFHLVYFSSPSADFSVRRVASRVRSGGHHIPEETIRRRDDAGIRSFVQLYRPIADTWDLVENTRPEELRGVASGSFDTGRLIDDPAIWAEMIERRTMYRNKAKLGEPSAAEGPEMIALMRRGVAEALREHKSEGRSVIAWDHESRQIVEIPPDEIVIPEDSIGETSD
jgi:predicted ABC-type ATPase